MEIQRESMLAHFQEQNVLDLVYTAGDMFRVRIELLAKMAGNQISEKICWQTFKPNLRDQL